MMILYLRKDLEAGYHFITNNKQNEVKYRILPSYVFVQEDGNSRQCHCCMLQDKPM